jgi:ribosomal protein L9
MLSDVIANMTLEELQHEQTKTDNEIKRIYCSRCEEKARPEKLQALQAIRKAVKEGIKAFHSVRLKDIQGIQTRA